MTQLFCTFARVYTPDMDTPGKATSNGTVPYVVDVAVDGARTGGQDGLLSYRVSEPWRQRIGVGQLVWVPLRRRLALGVIIRRHAERRPFPLKPIHAPVEPVFTLTPDQIEIATWLARETVSSLYAALSPFLPPGVTYRAVEYLRPTATLRDSAAVTPIQQRLLDLLEERGEMSLASARTAMGRSLTSVIANLEAQGALERVARVAHHAPHPRVDRFVRLLPITPDVTVKSSRQQAVIDFLERRSRLTADGTTALVPVADVLSRTGTDTAVISTLARKGVVEQIAVPRTPTLAPAVGTAVPELTPAQASAWRPVERALEARDPTPFLLHGVTGSGKTEVYLRAVAWCLRHGRSAFVLVPEIALASQIVRRFTERFPGEVAVLHSALADAERYATWRGIADGRFRVVVGPRSALFAPADNLGLIVLDEEHEAAYKQDCEPRYHARALAERLASQSGAVLLLGSATPAIETTWRATTGAINRLDLPDRVGPDLGDRHHATERSFLELPMVEIVDMRLELHRGNASLLSEPLHQLLGRTLDAREQAMLLLNRRGLATIVLCRACGESLICPFCDIPLVYHGDRQRLLCHRCNHREIPPRGCPSCGGALNYFGAGTQRVEDEVRRLFPTARVLRWDQDAVRRQGGHERLLHRVERREVDIVVGTQMIAKGLDLPLVTAVGVVHADTMLHLPDFRSAERTFQLLTQVAGRAGRRAPGSRVIIQSYTPDHYAIQAAARHDYATFYDEEIDFRRLQRYPPFTRLVRYLFRDADEEVCAAEAEEMARRLARHARSRRVPMDLLGPTPAFASRIRGRYQWQIILRAPDLEPLLDDLPTHPGWSIDVDPQSLL